MVAAPEGDVPSTVVPPVNRPEQGVLHWIPLHKPDTMSTYG